jgi:hypothetical protein
MKSFDLAFVQARQTYDLAVAFVDELRFICSPAAFEEIRQRNQSPEYKKSGACATHDFYDADVIMACAFEKTLGREVWLPSDLEAGRCTQEQCSEDQALWNAAWGFARSTGMI